MVGFLTLKDDFCVVVGFNPTLQKKFANFFRWFFWKGRRSYV